MNKYIYIIVFCCVGGSLFSQGTLKQYLNKGDDAAAVGNHLGAMNFYNEALKLDSGNADLWNKYGDAAIQQNAYSQAERAFSMVVDSLGGDYPSAYYNLAKAKTMLGKYDEAESYYNLYTSQYNDIDASKTKMANLGKRSAKWATDQPMENDAFSISKMDGGVNTGYSEFGPTLLDDDLYFSSLRFDGDEPYACSFSKVMENKAVTNTALKEANEFNIDNRLTGASAFSPDGSMLYYSLCDYNLQGEIICDLYAAKVDNGKVGGGTKLGGNINGEGYTSTMPSVSSDGTLYFASNRPGGKGGLDIYMASVGDGMDVGAVTAVADINTAGDDGTPFIASDGTLYFGSNGRIGFGGWDIYTTDGTEISNLGAEVNTSYDDLYFIVNDANAEGYLVSNRPGSMFIDEGFEACCYDLYRVTVEGCTVDLLALIRDCSEDMDLNDAMLTVTNNATGEVVYEDTKANSHKYNTEFDCESAYTVTAAKCGYNSASTTVGPYSGKRGIQEVEETLCLTPAMLNVSTYTSNCTTPLAATVTLYNETDGTKEVCESNNSCSFALDCDKNYRMVTTAPGGYNTDTQNFSTTMTSGSMSKQACLRKPSAPPCTSSLPVRLYFDNDYPNPKSRGTTTDKSYSELYNDYYAKKAEFIRKHGGKFGGKVRESAQSDVGYFFDNELMGGYNNMNRFLDCLIGQLQSGQSANIFLRGYASPIAQSDYNDALTQRRVQSVRNEISRYKGGILRTYLQNGQLKVTERGFGETASPSGVSDSRSDKRNSVYSPEASRERRVEIDEIKFNN